MSYCDHYLAELLPADFFDRLESGNFSRELYPAFSDRQAWEKVAGNPCAAEIIRLADEVPAGKVEPLLFSNYCQFNTNGNRTDYEEPYFKRRYNLAVLALSLCLTGDKEKYMSRLLDNTLAILEEWTWCVPAHAQWNRNDAEKWQFTDLFASETGAVMAQLAGLLGPELEAEFPGVSEMIRQKTLERTVRNVIFGNEKHWWFESTAPANWTIWCSFNNLAAALTLETDLKKLRQEAEAFLGAISRFISFCDDDGYCVEGPSYYNKSNLNVFRTLNLLEKVQPGCIECACRDKKIRAMLEFIDNIRIGEHYQVSYGDSQPGLLEMLGVTRAAGAVLKSEALMNFGKGQPASLGMCGDFLKESLIVLFDQPQEKILQQVPEREPAEKSCILFRDRLALLRSPGFSVSLKAGHNDEPHNHNDLGHFSLFRNAVPVIVDVGTGAYSKINFSDKRYTLWNTRGEGHNAPLVNGCEEVWGKEYSATLELVSDGMLRCDLSHAYPEKAGVRQGIRTLTFDAEKVVVEDAFVCRNGAGKYQLRLVSFFEPEVSSDGSLRLGDVQLSFEEAAFTGYENAPELIFTRSGHAVNIWGKQLYTLYIDTFSDCYRLIFTPGR